MAFKTRPETPADIKAIRSIIQAAFAAKSHLHHQESQIVDKLRASGNLDLSLVVEREGAVIGHISISTVQIEAESERIDGWYGLGPLAVHPDWQRQGVGSELVNQARETLRKREALGIVVSGRPQFYTRFGFLQDHALRFEGAPRRFFMALPLRGAVPSGTVRYHAAFDV